MVDEVEAGIAIFDRRVRRWEVQVRREVGRKKKWLRRIRGSMGMGLTWGLAWFSAGVALRLVIGLDAADVPFPLGFGLLGFLAGAIFSGVLSIVEGRHDFDQLSLPRFAG